MCSRKRAYLRQERVATIFINKLQFVVDQSAMTGADLRELVGPSVLSDHELIRVGAGRDRQDLLVHEDEVVELADGVEFITVPSRILAGRQRSH